MSGTERPSPTYCPNCDESGIVTQRFGGRRECRICGSEWSPEEYANRSFATNTYRLACEQCDWEDTAESKGKALDKRMTHEFRNNSDGPEHVTTWNGDTEVDGDV